VISGTAKLASGALVIRYECRHGRVTPNPAYPYFDGAWRNPEPLGTGPMSASTVWVNNPETWNEGKPIWDNMNWSDYKQNVNGDDAIIYNGQNPAIFNGGSPHVLFYIRCDEL
jgi:hypothetical protein